MENIDLTITSARLRDFALSTDANGLDPNIELAAAISDLMSSTTVASVEHELANVIVALGVKLNMVSGSSGASLDLTRSMQLLSEKLGSTGY